MKTSATGECEACPKNCLTCSSLTTCTKCDVGYAVKSGLCETVTKPANCQTGS